MSLRLPVLLVAAVAAVCLAAPSGASAYGKYVSFGDSSSTGSGLGAQKPGSLEFCYQTDAGYPTLVANALGVSEFVPRNCSASWINDLTTSQDYPTEGVPYAPPQFDSLTANTAIASITMGINDENGFSNVVNTCFQASPGNPSATPCKDTYVSGGVNQLVEIAKAMGYHLGQAIDRLYELAPNAVAFVVGYSRLIPPDGAGCWGKTNVSAGDAPVVDAWQQAVANQQKTVAAEHGAVYVDMYEASAGHDGCQADAAARWSNPQSQAMSTGWNNHPTLAGEQAMAARMIAVIDTPRPVRPGQLTPQKLSVKLASKKIRSVTSSAAPFTTVAPKKHGAKLTVRLARAGAVKFVINRAKPGHVKNGKCRALPRRASRGRKPCTRYLPRASRVISLPGGSSIVYITGRAAGKRLPEGRYRLHASLDSLSAETSVFKLSH